MSLTRPLYEIFRSPGDAQRRVYTGLLSDGLGHGGRRQKHERKTRARYFIL